MNGALGGRSGISITPCWGAPYISPGCCGYDWWPENAEDARAASADVLALEWPDTRRVRRPRSDASPPRWLPPDILRARRSSDEPANDDCWESCGCCGKWALLGDASRPETDGAIGSDR